MHGDVSVMYLIEYVCAVVRLMYERFRGCGLRDLQR